MTIEPESPDPSAGCDDATAPALVREPDYKNLFWEVDGIVGS